MAFLEELKSSVGSVLIQKHEQKIPYETDASYFQGSEPLAVVVPETVDQVSRIMKLCQKYSVPVVVRGGGTTLTGSSVPLDGFVVISMSRFDRIIEVEPQDRYAIVEPGVRLDTLNENLSHTGHFYPPDPASSMAATVGGSISTNAGGLRAATYGTTRNWVIGVEAVLPH